MLRIAQIDDADALATLSRLVQQLHVSGRPDVFVPTDHSTIAAWFQRRLVEPDVKAWVAEKDSIPVAYVFVAIRERSATPFTLPMRWIEIDQMGVHPDHQRMGVGRGLLEAVLDYARKQSIHNVRLKTWDFNKDAQAAFERLGFCARILEFELAC